MYIDLTLVNIILASMRKVQDISNTPVTVPRNRKVPRVPIKESV